MNMMIVTVLPLHLLLFILHSEPVLTSVLVCPMSMNAEGQVSVIYLCICGTDVWVCVKRTQEVEVSKPKERLHARQKVCCTDIIFLLLFIAFWGFLVCIRIWILFVELSSFIIVDEIGTQKQLVIVKLESERSCVWFLFFKLTYFRISVSFYCCKLIRLIFYYIFLLTTVLFHFFFYCILQFYFH